MPYTWPEDTDFALWELDVLDRDCPVCGRMMYVCDHRYRRIHTLEGPVQLVCKLNHCPDRQLPRPRHRPRAPNWKSRSLCPSGRSAGMSSVGSVIDGVHATGRFPRSNLSFCDDYAHQALGRLHRQVHPALPGHARRASARPRGPAAAIRIGR